MVLFLPFNLRIFTEYTQLMVESIAMTLLWGLIFENVIPDFYDIVGATIAIIGIVIIFYVPRKGEESLWQKQ